MSGAGSEVDQLLVSIQAALDATGVYVAPALGVQVGAEQLARVEAAVARSPEPVFVVVYPFSYDDAFGGNPGDLLSRLHDASGRDGLYVANEAVLPGSEVGLEARAWDAGVGTSADPYAVAAVGRESDPDDLGAQLVTVTEAVADGTLTEQYDALPGVVASRGDSGTGTGASGDDGGSATPYVVSGGVLLALVLAVVLSRRRPKPRPQAQPRAQVPLFTLPTSVLERAREAHDLQLTRRAHREVLSLGESIDAAEISAGDPPQAWQSALDHYEAARRILGDPADAGEGDGVDVLDVVGAIVMADRGRTALAAALRGDGFEPVVTCFLDPLHGPGTSEGSIQRDGDQVRVPLCVRCRAALKAGRRPDILDVVREGRAVHYFETDAEPWASTGYGALSPDLVERLQRG